MAEIVVADAGALIALGRLCKTEHIAEVFTKITIFRAVFAETEFRPGLPNAPRIPATRQPSVFPTRVGMNREHASGKE